MLVYGTYLLIGQNREINGEAHTTDEKHSGSKSKRTLENATKMLLTFVD